MLLHRVKSLVFGRSNQPTIVHFGNVEASKEASRQAAGRNADQDIQREFSRRRRWAAQETTARQNANGRPIWVIKCPAPDSNLRYHGGKYGDYAYCMTLRRNLEELGYYALLDCYEDWNCPVDADVVLVMRGVHSYKPNRKYPGTKYVLWIVSHPEMVEPTECDDYDLVLTDSELLATELQKDTSTPVRPFYVLVDTALFYPDHDASTGNPTYNRVFIGNTRGIMRDCVLWAHNNELPVDIWGAEWEKFFPNDPKLMLHGQLEYERTGDVYRESRVIINDHYKEMTDVGMLNNRFPEVLLCGGVMVCDWSKSFEEKFGEYVLFYRNEEEYLACLKQADERYEELREKVLLHHEELLEMFEMKRGLQRMQALIDTVTGEGI